LHDEAHRDAVDERVRIKALVDVALFRAFLCHLF
jgi:hypothetical protein